MVPVDVRGASPRARVLLALLTTGLLVLTAAWYPWRDVAVEIADLAVGLAFLCLAVVALPRSRGLALLSAAVSVTWWAGSVWPEAVFWHRGPLFHLLLTYPAPWPRGVWIRGAVGLSYAAALWPGLWADPRAAVLLSVALLIARVVRSTESRSWVVTPRVSEIVPTAVVSAAIIGDAIAHAVVPSGAAVRPSFLVFCLALVTAALVLIAGLRRSDAARVADLVVELGEHGPSDLRSELARALRDPGLELATARGGAFVDASGDVVAPPVSGDSRRAVVVTRTDAPDLLIVHGASPWDEPVLRGAVDRWIELSRANADLRSRARATIDDVAASRRRLLIAADAEQERLSHRIEDSVTTPLKEVHALLTASPQPHPLIVDRLERVIDRLGITSEGLAPPVPAGGLEGALRRLAADAPMPVSVSVVVESGANAEVERAAYYVCAEALANAVKHSGAARVVISVRAEARWLVVEVEDDGTGGAQPGRGSGLSGLLDRVAALGGRLAIDSQEGVGTTVRALFPT